MDLKLTVLAGARKGTVIPLKKDEFIIGRAAKCSLRAGSEAISRQHCMIVRTADGYFASDMGSRNGTFVNDKIITERTALREGDELRIGPLKFRMDRSEGTKKKATSKPAAADSQEIGDPRSKKKPGAVSPSGAGPDNGHMEEDISRWLIGTESGTKSMQETVNFHMEETRAISRVEAPHAVELDSLASEDIDAVSAAGDNDESEVEDSKQSGWSTMFNRSKSKESPDRKKPGKLPKIPEKDKAKDSCEAAAETLREMTRRR